MKHAAEHPAGAQTQGARGGRSAGASVQQTSLAYDLAMLFLKIGVIAFAFVALFTFVFGLYRVADTGMKPVFQDGDLIAYYRLDRNFVASEVAALTYEGNVTAGRVIAVGGDDVDIDYKGLKVNGSYQQELGISQDTTQVADGVTFPLTVPEGSVFLLGDNRGEAVDSRIYGCIPVDELNGKVMAQFRRRGF